MTLNDLKMIKSIKDCLEIEIDEFEDEDRKSHKTKVQLVRRRTANKSEKNAA